MYDIRGYTPSWGSLTSYMSSILPGGGPRTRNGELENRPFADYEQRMGGMAGYNTIVPDALVVSLYWPPEHFDGIARQANLPWLHARLVESTRWAEVTSEIQSPMRLVVYVVFLKT